MEITLTTPEYVIASNCEKYYWQKTNRPHLANDIDTTVDSTLNQIKFLGTRYLASGTDIKGAAEPYTATMEELRKQSNIILYNAAFKSPNGLYSINCDAIVKTGQILNFFLIKSNVKISEPNDVYEIGFVYYVLKTLGYKPGNIRLTILNLDKYYLREDFLSITDFFIPTDVTHRGKNNHYQVELNLRQWALRAKNTVVPAAKMTAFCFQHKCPFINACWGEFQGLNMFTVNHFEKNKVTSLYKRGLVELSDIPNRNGQIKKPLKDEGIKGFNKTKVREYLEKNNLTDGFYSLSLVPYKSPLPHYYNSRPYFAMEYQFSLVHFIGGEEKHYNFLIDKNFKFRSELIKNLLRITEEPGSLVVSNFYEIKKLFQYFIETYPKLKKRILELQGRLVDLMIPFDKNYYPHPSFKIYKLRQSNKKSNDEDGNPIVSTDEKKPPSVVSFKSIIPLFIKDWEYKVDDWDMLDDKSIEDKVAIFPYVSEDDYEKYKRSIFRYHDLMATIQLRVIQRLQQLNK